MHYVVTNPKEKPAMRLHHILFALLLVAPAAWGVDDENKGKVIEKPVAADTPEKFSHVVETINLEMTEGGRYEYINPGEKARVVALLGQMSNLLERSGSVDKMDSPTRIQLFNNQEEVNGLLTHNDSNRLVCERIKPIGSNIPQTHCHTYGQLQETARNTRQGMDQFDSSRKCGKVAGPGAGRSATAGASLCGGS
jgi:hypothetical protein